MKQQYRGKLLGRKVTLLVAASLAFLALRAQAQEGEAQEARKLDEIVVTAQKREQRLQDVPVSVTAVSGSLIEEQDLDNLEEISEGVAGVRVNTENLVAEYYIRGMGTESGNVFPQSVSLIVDNVGYADPFFATASMADIAQIEFLKGPQGTLFGTNTAAGAIHVMTNQPHDEWEVKASGTYGEFGTRRANLVLNMPLWSEKIAVRLFGNISNMEGYIHNAELERREATTNEYALGGKIAFNMFDGFSLKLGGRYIINDLPNGFGRQASHSASPYREVILAFDPNFETNVDYNASSDFAGKANMTGFAYDANIGFSVGNQDVSIIAAHSKMDLNVDIDGDFSPAPLVEFYWDWERSFTTLEVRFVNSTPLMDGTLNYVAGIFASQEDWVYEIVIDAANFEGVVEALDLGLPANLLQPLANAEHLVTNRASTNTTLAAFGQFDWAFWQDFELTAGLRIGLDRQELDYLSIKSNLSSTPFPGPLGLAGGIYDYEARGLSQDKWYVNPKLALSYRFDEARMIFASIAQGVKAGGFVNAPGQNPSLKFKPEKSTNVELGWKTEWMDGVVRANGAIFYTLFEDLQVRATDGVGGDGFLLLNAAEAVSKGVELEVASLLPFGFMFNGSATWMDAKYSDYPNAPCPVKPPPGNNNETCDLTNKPLVNAPEWSGAASLLWTYAFRAMPIAITIGGTAAYQGDVQLQADNDPLDFQRAYWNYSAFASLADVDGVWRLTVNGKNLSDEIVKRYSTDMPVLNGSHYAQVAPPRMITATVSVQF